MAWDLENTSLRSRYSDGTDFRSGAGSEDFEDSGDSEDFGTGREECA